MTGTIGVAHSEYWTGSMVPALSSLSRYCSIFSLRAYGTDLALWRIGVAVGSTWILAFVPCKVPSPSSNSWACFCKISSSRLLCDESCLIMGQFSLIFSSQFLPSKAGPLPPTTKSGREYSTPSQHTFTCRTRPFRFDLFPGICAKDNSWLYKLGCLTCWEKVVV